MVGYSQTTGGGSSSSSSSGMVYTKNQKDTRRQVGDLLLSMLKGEGVPWMNDATQARDKQISSDSLLKDFTTAQTGLNSSLANRGVGGGGMVAGAQNDLAKVFLESLHKNTLAQTQYNDEQKKQIMAQLLAQAQQYFTSGAPFSVSKSSSTMPSTYGGGIASSGGGSSGGGSSGGKTG